jgi:cobalt-precorrin 5A hydrolase/precorrin-3B C17-methyltransferase
LSIIGIGPGDAVWRTPEANAALASASDIVGYQLYLDLLGAAILGKRHHTAPMTEEEARVRQALDLAAEGRQVALVSSGDAGIYGLSSLTFELLERERRSDWNRIDLVVVPGLSAFQAAAARVGAPTGHDFCVISLSDLLTPWPVIETRLRVAGEGDFVIALYNPVSHRRRQQLVVARDLLLRHRPASTPVALVRNAGREGEAIQILPLVELTADHADMLTVIIVGSSHTRCFTTQGRKWLYTPRGYGARQEAARSGE